MVTNFEQIQKMTAEEVPPAPPKKGKWIKITHTLYKCDQCGAVQIKGAYCKDCNAEMEGRRNE